MNDSGHVAIHQLTQHLGQSIVGQQKLLNRLLIGVLTGGHILLEGLPGLAKTTAVKALAGGIHASFQRIQFTPDLMPGDVTGTDIYDPHDGVFKFVSGPIFNEILLADEINRAPPKVQSALLEAMQEHQVTVSGVTRKLPQLFIVMATQNPLEQAGTYPLPEAQLDRFLLHVVLDYPSAEEELEILRRDHGGKLIPPENTSGLTPDIILQQRARVAGLHIEEALEKYIVQLVSATRRLGDYIPAYAHYLDVGASPRASMAMLHAACAHAFIAGRDYVSPDDIIEIAPDVLRHRIILSYEAQADGVGKDRLIDQLLKTVPVP